MVLLRVLKDWVFICLMLQKQNSKIIVLRNLED